MIVIVDHVMDMDCDVLDLISLCHCFSCMSSGVRPIRSRTTPKLMNRLRFPSLLTLILLSCLAPEVCKGYNTNATTRICDPVCVYDALKEQKPSRNGTNAKRRG
jgi:hypothetical protein